MTKQMHAPLQYATDKLLRRAKVDGGLDGLLTRAVADQTSSQVVTAEIARLTKHVIIVDRRTTARWMADVEADTDAE